MAVFVNPEAPEFKFSVVKPLKSAEQIFHCSLRALNPPVRHAEVWHAKFDGLWKQNEHEV